MARWKDGTADTSKHQPRRSRSVIVSPETRRRPQESSARAGRERSTHAGGRRQTKRTGRVRRQRSGADAGARSIGNGSADLIGRLPVIPAEQSRDHNRPDREGQEAQRKPLDDPQHGQGVQSLQVPSAVQEVQTVPSEIFTVPAAVSVVTVAFSAFPPLSVKYLTIFETMAVAVSA